MMRIGLRAALLSAFLFASGAPLLVFWLWPYSSALDHAMRGAREHHLVLARNTAITLEHYYDDMVSTFEVLAPEIAAGVETKAAQPLLAGFSFAHVCVADRETGVVRREFLAALAPCPAVIPPDRLAMFRTLTSDGGVGVSPVMTPGGGPPRLFVAIALDETLVVAAVTTARLHEIAEAVGVGRTGHAVIVDAMGRVLAHPVEAWRAEARDLSDMPIVRRMMRGESGVDRFVSPAFGVEMIAGFATVAAAGWGVMAPEPLADITTRADSATTSAGLVFAAGMALSTLLALFFSSRLSAGLRNLSDAAQRMARGEIGVRASQPAMESALSEVATVGRTFNLMGQRIEAAHARMLAIASADSLTGLLNRSGFLSAAEPLLREAEANGTEYALFFIDLDRFKAVNDGHGHDVGDQLLRQIADRLRRTVAPHDLIARQGGDEFLVLHRKTDTRACARLGARLLRALQGPACVGDNVINVTVSIGVSTFPRDAADARALILRADQAMYHAKRSGRNRLRFFDAALRRRIDEDVALKRELREAICAGGVEAEFQPIVDARTGALCGFEALARWTSPTLGPITPARFVAIAEDTGLIVDMGRQMRTRAFAFAATLRRSGVSAPVSVNVSQIELAQASFATRLLEQLDAHQLQPGSIILEITESLFQVHAPRELNGLFALRAKGVSFALDDFGKGFSSHSHLRTYPVDHIKIATDFVGDIVTDPRARAVVRSLVDLGRSLKLTVTVEGVETREQRDLVAQMAVDRIQGYWHHAPMGGAAAFRLAVGEATRRALPSPSLAAAR